MGHGLPPEYWEIWWCAFRPSHPQLCHHSLPGVKPNRTYLVHTCTCRADDTVRYNANIAASFQRFYVCRPRTVSRVLRFQGDASFLALTGGCGITLWALRNPTRRTLSTLTRADGKPRYDTTRGSLLRLLVVTSVGHILYQEYGDSKVMRTLLRITHLHMFHHSLSDEIPNSAYLLHDFTCIADLTVRYDPGPCASFQCCHIYGPGTTLRALRDSEAIRILLHSLATRGRPSKVALVSLVSGTAPLLATHQLAALYHDQYHIITPQHSTGTTKLRSDQPKFSKNFQKEWPKKSSRNMRTQTPLSPLHTQQRSHDPKKYSNNK